MITPKLILISHGLKKGPPPRAHCYLDARGLPDAARGPLAPNWEETFDLKPYMAILMDGLNKLDERRRGGTDAQRPFIVCTLCAFGINRSPALKRMLFAYLRAAGYDVELGGPEYGGSQSISLS